MDFLLFIFTVLCFTASLLNVFILFLELNEHDINKLDKYSRKALILERVEYAFYASLCYAGGLIILSWLILKNI